MLNFLLIVYIENICHVASLKQLANTKREEPLRIWGQSGIEPALSESIVLRANAPNRLQALMQWLSTAKANAPEHYLDNETCSISHLFSANYTASLFLHRVSVSEVPGACFI